MIKFIDANIFIERWTNDAVRKLIDDLDRDKHCTFVLVLAEVYHKLIKKGVKTAFDYLRNIMGAIKVYDITQNDFFIAMSGNSEININDRIHIAVMKRNNISSIISFDKDFDKDKTITREEV